MEVNCRSLFLYDCFDGNARSVTKFQIQFLQGIQDWPFQLFVLANSFRCATCVGLFARCLPDQRPGNSAAEIQSLAHLLSIILIS